MLTQTKLGPWFVFGVVIIISLYNWSPLLDAGWSIIDDHEIVSVIGMTERLPISEIPAALKQTELSSASGALRFRPSYYGLRFLEAATWGKQPQLWYAARIAIFLFFGLILASLCLRLGGPILTLFFTVFELSRPYWADIFARLGPAEAYAILGSSLIAYGFIAAKKIGWRILPCLAIAAGVVVAAGSKENFVVLAIVPLWLIFSRNVRLSFGLRLIFWTTLGYVVWIATAVIGRIAHTGHDVYANPVSIKARLGLLNALVTQPHVLVWMAAIVGLFLTTLVLSQRDETNQSMLDVRRSAWMMAVLLAVFASQFVFYSGQWPVGAVPRYLFPGILAEHLAVFLFFVALINIIRARRFAPRNHGWFVYLIVAWYFGMPAVANFGTNRAASMETVTKSTAFTVSLNKSLNYLREHPSGALILHSHSVLDYEPIYSLERFVRASGLHNPIALKIDGYSAAVYSTQDSQQLSFMLAGALERIQLEGQTGFVPLRTTGSSPECFSIGLSGPPLARCEAGTTLVL